MTILRTVFVRSARSSLRWSLVFVSALGCGSDGPCLYPPCAASFAVGVTVRATGSASTLAGAFVQAAGSAAMPCGDGSDGSCMIPGGAGTYQLDIGAPGFQTVHRSVIVSGTDAGCGTCGSVDTQHIVVVLTPSA